MVFKLEHKKITDEEAYENIKKAYKQNPNILMNPKQWKQLRLKKLKKEGKIWSK